MKVSVQWVLEILDAQKSPEADRVAAELRKIGPEGLAELLTRRGLEVEEIHRQGVGFEKVVTAKILERNRHPDADKLSVCKVTRGTGEPLDIVCGAQNMKAGDIVALAQEGAHLPNGLQITVSKIRGVQSNGMLCSEEELKLKDSSEGIMILPPDTKLGQPLAQVLGMNDTVLELKLTANRGDCLSHWGIVREVGAAFGWVPKEPKIPAFDLKGGAIQTAVEAGEDGPQFLGLVVEGVKVGPSPAWVVKRLETLGLRSINNVVDATNLVLWEFGQPLHAYDADLLKGKKLRVRPAKAGEELPLLDDTSVKLDGSELVIADDERPVALAGVMGGGNSEVRDGTKRLFLECAEFDPIRVRRAATRHGKKTDSSHRFERGVDPRGQKRALCRLAQYVTEWAGGQVKGGTEAYAPSRDPKRGGFALRTIPIPSDYFEKFLGLKIEKNEVTTVLQSLDCRPEESAGGWKVTVPSYRWDLMIPEDLAEEVARSVGYDRIPTTLPTVTSALTPQGADPAGAGLALLDRAKDVLAAMGLSETVSYAFTSRASLASFGMSSDVAVQNPMSEEQEVLVPSLIPSMVGMAAENFHRHFGSEVPAVRLFQIRPTFFADPAAQTRVREVWKLSVLISGGRYKGGLKADQCPVDFFDLKALVESFVSRLGCRGVRLQSGVSSEMWKSVFHPGQSMELLAGKGDRVGAFGLLHPRVSRSLKIKVPLWILELDWDQVSKFSRPLHVGTPFQGWGEFPGIERDFALLVKDGTEADQIVQSAMRAGRPLAKVVRVFDIYKGPQVPEGMTSIAVRVIFLDEKRSLQETEADQASERILAQWKKDLGATLRV